MYESKSSTKDEARSTFRVDEQESPKGKEKQNEIVHKIQRK